MITRCQKCGNTFEGEGYRVKAKFHDGEITVCPQCYRAMTPQGCYVASNAGTLEWRHRAAAAVAANVKWEKLPTTELSQALDLAKVVTHIDPVGVDQPGFVAYLSGDWLIAQKVPPDPDRYVYVLDLSKSVAKPRPKPVPVQKPEVVTRVSPLMEMQVTPRELLPCTSLADVQRDWEMQGFDPSYATYETGRYMVIETKEGKYWYFQRDNSCVVKSMFEYVMLYPDSNKQH